VYRVDLRSPKKKQPAIQMHASDFIL
jgi:hypothetical protein